VGVAVQKVAWTMQTLLQAQAQVQEQVQVQEQEQAQQPLPQAAGTLLPG